MFSPLTRLRPTTSHGHSASLPDAPEETPAGDLQLRAQDRIADRAPHDGEQVRGGDRVALGCARCVQSRLRWLRPCGREVSSSGELHHHIQKPELVSGFFTSAVCASSGGASRIRLASGTPPIPTVLALRCLSVLRFYLFASRACARSLPVLVRISGWSVVVANC